MHWRASSVIRPSAGFIQPCLPSPAARPPRGPGWIFEIKHDGYRLMIRRSGESVRIYTRRGADWTPRFPRIVEGVRKLRVSSVLLDGEGVIFDDNGLAIFDKLHSKANDADVVMFAFDVLELDGEDCRAMRLLERKARLRKLLSRVKHGIHYTGHLDADGHAVFKHACKFRCEGIVAKRVDSRYQSGRTKTWLKVKNPQSPAALRIEEGTF